MKHTSIYVLLFTTIVHRKVACNPISGDGTYEQHHHIRCHKTYTKHWRRSIDIEVSRLAIGFQTVCILRLSQYINTTCNFYEEELPTSRILSPSDNLPSAAAAPSSRILVTNMPLSSGICGMSYPPLMLNPRPSANITENNSIQYFSSIIIFISCNMLQAIDSAVYDNRLCRVKLRTEIQVRFTGMRIRGKKLVTLSS